MSDNALTNQLESNYEAIKEWLLGLKANAENPGVDIPMFQDVIGSLDHADLWAQAIKNALKNPSLSGGHIIDAVHDIEGTGREYFMRSMSKRDYFDAAAEYYDKELYHESEEVTRKINYILGNTLRQRGE